MKFSSLFAAHSSERSHWNWGSPSSGSIRKGIPAKKVSINNSHGFGEIIEETDVTFVMLQASASPGGKGRRGMVDCIIPTSRQYCLRPYS